MSFNYQSNTLLGKNYLSSNIFYSSISHTDKILKKYFEYLDEGFYEMKKSIDNESIFKLRKNLKNLRIFRKWKSR